MVKKFLQKIMMAGLVINSVNCMELPELPSILEPSSGYHIERAARAAEFSSRSHKSNKSNLSTGAKIGIGVASAVVIAGAVYGGYRLHKYRVEEKNKKVKKS
jgi:hypothetical protein